MNRYTRSGKIFIKENSMLFSYVDWGIVIGMLLILIIMAFVSNRYTNSVADYLVAGRAAGRYMMTMASGMVWIGAINVVAMFELYHYAGFTAMWWVLLTTPATLYINITGWGVYRFRETRALTIAQFLETRYSKKLRIYAGVVAWIAGLINFGLFPAIGARFFMAFCNMPISFEFLGMTMQTFPVVMILLLGVSLFFVFMGGQIAVMVTDCLQGMFTQIAAIVITAFLFVTAFNWDKILYVLQKVGDPAAGKSLLDPLHAWNQAGGFSVWFFIISIIGYFYSILSNMQSQAYVASAKSAHEFRIGSTLNIWRWQALLVFFMVLVLCAMVVLYHPDYKETAAQINTLTEKMVATQATEAAKESLRGQLVITTALSHILPVGLAGLFCAIMLAALISTYDSFMHTWGTVFLQDIVMPFRKKPIESKKHLWLLRISIFFVAIFAFFFSWLFPNPENILMYFALVNTLWLGGAGAVILGGLYWKKGTNTASLVTLTIGAILGILGIFFSLFWPRITGDKFPVNPQWYFFFTIIVCFAVYIFVSLLGNENFNMDKLLYRGKYSIDGGEEVFEDTKWYEKIFGINAGFDKKDSWIAYLIVGWFLSWMLFFIVGTVYAKIFDPSESVWARFWYIYLCILFVMAVITTIWFTIGSLRDMYNLFVALKNKVVDDTDNGFVVHNDADDHVEEGSDA